MKNAELVTLIIRGVCEAEPGDPDHKDTVCIGVEYLRGILEACIETAIPHPSLATPAAAVASMVPTRAPHVEEDPVAYRYRDRSGSWRYVGAPVVRAWGEPSSIEHEPLYSSPRLTAAQASIPAVGDVSFKSFAAPAQAAAAPATDEVWSDIRKNLTALRDHGEVAELDELDARLLLGLIEAQAAAVPVPVPVMFSTPEGFGGLIQPERGPCTICGVPYAKHGSYPDCATHAYTTKAQAAAVPEQTVGSALTDERVQVLESAIRRALDSLCGDYPSMAADLRATLSRPTAAGEAEPKQCKGDGRKGCPSCRDTGAAESIDRRAGQ